MTVHLPLLSASVPAIIIGDDYRIRGANDAYLHAYVDAPVREAGDGADRSKNAPVREAGDGADRSKNAPVREAGDGAFSDSAARRAKTSPSLDADALRAAQAMIVGRHCYEVSHRFSSPCDENGESCPLRAARRTGAPSRVFHVHHHRDGEEHVDVLLRPTSASGEPLYIEEIQVIKGVRAARGDFTGKGPAFRKLVGMLRRVASSDVPVLLHGGPGTGKATAARVLHHASRRAAGPFVAMRSVPPTAEEFDRILYGSEGGERRMGTLENARGGTLFLEDVASVPSASQTRLLKTMEDGTFRREKSSEVRRSDVRFLFSAQTDLRDAEALRTMKGGFLAHVRSFPIRVPSLAERREDIPAICAAYIAQRWPGRSLHLDVVRRLASADYRANVTELILVIDRLMILSDSAQVCASDLPEDLFDAMAELGPVFRVVAVTPLADVEANYVTWAAQQQPERRALAQELGVSERTLYRLLAAKRRPGD